MEITVVNAPDSVDIIALTGRLNAFTAPMLREAVQEVFDKKRYQVIIDFAAVEHMGSAGIHALCSLLKTALQNQGNLTIARLPSRIRWVIELVGLENHLPIYEEVSDAIASFQLSD